MNISASEDDRRARQLRDITEAIKSPTRGADGVCHVGTHTRELSAAVGRSRVGPVVWEEAGPGLLLVVRRGDDGNPDNVIPPDGALNEQVHRLIHPTTSLNSLVVGSFAYDTDGSPINVLGQQPLLWQALDSTVLSDILFSRVTVLTIFNPAHILASLNADGFETTFVKPPLTYRVAKSVGDQRVELFGLDHFFRLRTLSLYQHESVLDVLREAIGGALRSADGRPAKVDLRVGHPLTPPTS